MSLYGLRDFSSNEVETRHVITALGPYIRDFKGSFNVQNVAGAFQGLQKMKSGRYRYVCMYVCMSGMCVCMRVCMSVMCVCMCVCINVSVCVCVCKYECASL